MTFESQKTTSLQKQDKSKKGEPDDAIIPLLDCLNACPDFYTTSSCAGRICLITDPTSGKKNEASWLFSSHAFVSLDELRASLQSLPTDLVWFRMEGFIIHVCCRSIDHACRLVSAARDAGVKRAGIISAGERITVELIDTERVDCPISRDGVLIVSEEYLSYVIDCANKKLKKTREKIKKVKEAFSASNAFF